jgi:4a-hydroxytetrahydrobiopterin dehydratase
MELKEMKCVPCEGGMDPMNKAEVESIYQKLNHGWNVQNYKAIHKSYNFEDFKRGMAFANRVALLAEEENHHPDLCIHYKKVDITLSTHAIGGLSMNDFILAAKIDEI